MARTAPSELDIRTAGAASTDAGATEFTAATQASPWVQLQGRFFFGAWPGQTNPVGGKVQLQCSPDGGTTILNCSEPDGSNNEWNVPIAHFPSVHGEAHFSYRLYCSALTSGAIAWRLSQ